VIKLIKRYSRWK